MRYYAIVGTKTETLMGAAKEKAPVGFWRYLWLKICGYDVGTFDKLVYIICPVRNITSNQREEVERYVKRLEEDGNLVHYPPRDVDQTDETGYNICEAHRDAMLNCNEVHIYWDKKSTGSHFDLGMAFSLFKKIVLLKHYQEREKHKSFLNMIYEYERRVR